MLGSFQLLIFKVNLQILVSIYQYIYSSISKYHVFLVPVDEVRRVLKDWVPSVRHHLSYTAEPILFKLCTKAIPYGIQIHVNLFRYKIHYDHTRGSHFVTTFHVSEP